MEAGIVLIILGLGLLSGSALLAFSWAARDGQLDDLENGARVIFEAEEINHQGHGGEVGAEDEKVGRFGTGAKRNRSEAEIAAGKSPEAKPSLSGGEGRG